ncbi:DUF4405 domain-containing protein [Vibrio sp. 10N.261.51.F12]|uniref:DUF4405 domain-containing protein n=1 Tax=Vibrio sp. 10N.261.51.F12 TaxID=3229679 RepID=UPI003551D4BC
MQTRTWKDSLVKTQYVMDILLLVSFIFVCIPKATGVAAHEWLSLLFIIPLIIHLLLHWDWMVSLPKNFIHKQSAKDRFNAVWDALFYLVMLMATLSGFLASEALLPQLNMPVEILPVWSKLHHDLGNLVMPMLGIHLALHWQWIKGVTSKMRQKHNTKAGV